VIRFAVRRDMIHGENAEPVREAEIGRRLDHAVAARCGLSHRRARRLLDRGGVWLNGAPISLRQKGRLLQTGDTLTIDHAALEDRAQPNHELPLHEAARGHGWIVIDKPAGQPTHPLKPDESDTALNALLARCPEVHGVGEGGLRSGVVHRLDVATSGALSFARDQATWQALREAFHGGDVYKAYHALVAGRIHSPEEHAMWLRVASHSPARVVPVNEHDARVSEAWLCRLSYKPVEHFDDATLLEVTLQTGFLHQIRVMLAALGHPIIGDTRYGPAAASDEPGRDPVERLMLHAYRLRWGPIDATCPWPGDFNAGIERWR